MTTETDKKNLIELPDKAEHLAGQFSGGYSGQFFVSSRISFGIGEQNYKTQNRRQFTT